MGSSIVSPAITEFSSVFGVGPVTATLTLSLFVVGYGVGPLFLSPISEIPQIGRSIPYIVTLALFCILQVPTALVNNFAGLVSPLNFKTYIKKNANAFHSVSFDS
jgi:DHA1 family multidrug resistance protein-like MFS transporter